MPLYIFHTRSFRFCARKKLPTETESVLLKAIYARFRLAYHNICISSYVVRSNTICLKCVYPKGINKFRERER